MFDTAPKIAHPTKPAWMTEMVRDLPAAAKP
jgi:hypothetical protein